MGKMILAGIWKLPARKRANFIRTFKKPCFLISRLHEKKTNLRGSKVSTINNNTANFEKNCRKGGYVKIYKNGKETQK